MRIFRKKKVSFEEYKGAIKALGHRLQQSHNLAEIIEYIKDDKLTLDVMEHHGLTFKDFDHWLETLVLSGAGQVARGTYVPAMVFLMPATMDFVATTLRRKDWDEHNKWLFISTKMVEFLEGGNGVSGSFFGNLK